MPHIKCNGIRVYYEIHGQGNPVLFLNGLSSDILRKQPFINAAKEKFKIIVPDLRGAGLTEIPRAKYSVPQFARDAYDLLTQLGYDQISVMGFSMGGFIAMQLAIDYPECVDKLILTSTKPAWNRPLSLSAEAVRLMYSDVADHTYFRELFYFLHGSVFKNTVEAEDYVLETMNMPNPQPAHGYLGQLAACENFDLIDRLDNIIQPTLIITGKEDQLISSENSLWMHEKIKDSKLIVYEGVGHMPVNECAEKLAEDMSDFLVLNKSLN